MKVRDGPTGDHREHMSRCEFRVESSRTTPHRACQRLRLLPSQVREIADMAAGLDEQVARHNPRARTEDTVGDDYDLVGVHDRTHQRTTTSMLGADQAFGI